MTLMLFELIGYDIPLHHVIKQFFPLLFKNNWFILCYIFLYVLHPVLNYLINKLSREQLKIVICSMFLMYAVIGQVISNAYYNNDFIGFVFLYLFTALLKDKNITYKKSIQLLTLGLLLIIGLKTSCAVVGTYYAVALKFMGLAGGDIGIGTLLIGTACISIASKDSFHNKFINFIASTSLIYYLIHENYLIRNYIKLDLFYKRVYDLCGKNYSYVYVLIYALMLIVIGGLLSSIWKVLIDPIINKISNWIKYKFRATIFT